MLTDEVVKSLFQKYMFSMYCGRTCVIHELGNNPGDMLAVQNRGVGDLGVERRLIVNGISRFTTHWGQVADIDATLI